MIIASCGHEATIDGLFPVEYEDEDCDALDGFRTVTVYAIYCKDCYERFNGRSD